MINGTNRFSIVRNVVVPISKGGDRQAKEGSKIDTASIRAEERKKLQKQFPEATAIEIHVHRAKRKKPGEREISTKFFNYSNSIPASAGIEATA